jgi:hypothetical protein
MIVPVVVRHVVVVVVGLVMGNDSTIPVDFQRSGNCICSSINCSSSRIDNRIAHLERDVVVFSFRWLPLSYRYSISGSGTTINFSASEPILS